MPTYTFALIVQTEQLSDEKILDAADSLADAGCTDASLRGHKTGMEIVFEREATSLQEALTTAIADVENSSFQVSKIEMDREALVS